MESPLPPPPAHLPAVEGKRNGGFEYPQAKYQNTGEQRGIDVCGNMDKNQQFITNSAMDPVMHAIQGERYISGGTFNNVIYVKIRDYNSRYNRKLSYTKKGINLTLAQWQHVKELMPYIDEGIKTSNVHFFSAHNQCHP